MKPYKAIYGYINIESNQSEHFIESFNHQLYIARPPVCYNVLARTVEHRTKQQIGGRKSWGVISWHGCLTILLEESPILVCYVISELACIALDERTLLLRLS